MRRAGFDPDGHSGKALVNVLENYPRDELFQIDEDTLYQLRARDPAARRAAARARAAAARPLRPLRLGPGVRAARALRQRRPQAIGDYLAERLQGPRRGLLSVLPGRPAGARPFHHRRATAATTPNPDRADARARGRGTSCAPGPTSSPRRSRWCTSRSSAQQLLARYRDAFSARLSRGLFAADGGRRHPAASRGFRRAGRSASISTAAPRDRHRGVGLKVWSREQADPAVRARAGAGEHGLPGGRRAHLPDRAAAPRSAGRLAARHDAGARRRRRGRPRGAEGAASKPPSWW